MSKRKVSYYYDTDLGSFSYGYMHPMKPHRMRVTHDLVRAYGMLPKMHVLRPKRATPEAMTSFHTDEYIHFLARVTPETVEELTYHGTRFLVGEDNPAFEGVFDFCSISAGGSIAAANRITSGAADIAINWAGGLHHAKKREASGFCYINDIVLGILELLRTYPRVLYVDIDCHHGDGVEEAFYTTDRVMTCSFHKFGEYFPGTGTQEDRGRGKGRGYAVNVPLKDGIGDESFKSIFEPVIDRILKVFQPSAVVLQCGADSLSGDKLGCFNITMHGHSSCVQFLRKYNLPLILLGGGGYTVKNVARTWTYETACALGIEDEIDPNLPWNEYFEWFGPRYRLEVVSTNMEDCNIKDGSLEKVRVTALEQIGSLQGPPSVQMQDTPRESLGVHLGFGRDEEEGRDELDEKLAQHARYVYNLQETSDTATESDDSWDSDESTTYRRAQSSRRVHKRPSSTLKKSQRMSILSNSYYDVPVHESGYEHYNTGGVTAGDGKAAGGRRRFFQSGARWDEGFERVVPVVGGGGIGAGELAALMERGGREVADDALEAREEEWDDGGMILDAC